MNSIALPLSRAAGALAVLLLGLAYVSAAAADPPAILSLPDASGVVGERIEIALDIADADSMQAGTIEIAYDPERIAPDPESIGGGPFGPSLPVMWGASIPAAAIFRIVFATADETGFVGSGTLATFEVDLIRDGTSAIAFDSIRLERTPDLLLPANGIDGSILVSPLPVAAGTWGGVKQRFSSGP